MRIAGHVETADVLLRDVGVGADVDDVDTLHAPAVLEVFDGAGYHAASDETLAQTGFVGDEEPPGRLRTVEAAGDVLHSGALEPFQSCQRGLGVELPAPHRPSAS